MSWADVPPYWPEISSVVDSAIEIFFELLGECIFENAIVHNKKTYLC